MEDLNRRLVNLTGRFERSTSRLKSHAKEVGSYRALISKRRSCERGAYKNGVQYKKLRRYTLGWRKIEE